MAINNMSQAITTLTQSMAQMQQDINNLKAQTLVSPKPLPTKTYSHWKKNTFDKLRILTDYTNEHSDQELKLSDTLHITINEMQDTYDVDIFDYTRNYMLENSSETKPYDLDVIDYYTDLKKMYNMTINSILEKLNLNVPAKSNIFDELAKKL